MTKHLIFTLMLVTAMLGAAIRSADAGPILVNSIGTVTNATAVDEVVNSIGMVGILQMTATFSDNLTETLTWGLITDPCGGACPNFRGVAGTGWSLGGAGGTSAMQWQFSGRTGVAINSLSFFGTNLAYDRSTGYSTVSPVPEGTPGSSSGFDFSPVDSSISGDLAITNGWTATYSNAVSLNGAAPVGDVYARLVVDFGQGGYLGNFNFLQDTDFYTPAPVTPGGGGNDGGGSPVPEPASIVLLGSGLLGLAAARRRLA